MKLLSGLCNCDKYLPLRYMGGLTTELELESDPLEPIISDPYVSGGVGAEEQTLNSPYRAATQTIALLQEANISRDWNNF